MKYNNDEEMHYWFTVTEFARLCEEYGLDQVLKDFSASVDIWDAVSKDTDGARGTLGTLEYLKWDVINVIMCKQRGNSNG